MHLTQHSPRDHWPVLVSDTVHMDHDEMILPRQLRHLDEKLAYTGYEVELFFKVYEDGTTKLVGARDEQDSVGITSHVG
jgi:hypothetical protein